jgi:hypothetical protein
MRDMGKFLAVLVTWLMVLVALAQGGPGGPGGPGGQPTLSAQFNLNDWMVNEPATDKNHFPDQLPAVEGNTITVVYDKGGSAQVQLFFRNNNPNQNFTGQLIVEDARYIHDSAPLPVPWGSPPPVTIPDTILSAPTVSLNIASLATAPTTLTISGLPAFVTKGHIQLQMRAEGNFGAQVTGSQSLVPWSGGLSSQKVLITYAPPTGVMVPVWTEVAELSCTMAQGESTLADVSSSLSKGLFFSNLFWYFLPQGAMHYTHWTSPTDVKFNLSKFVIDMGYPGAEPGGCVDINTFLGILNHSQGIFAVGRRAKIAGPYGFLTNEFVPSGWDASQSSLYIRVAFGYHYQLVSGGQVYDSAMAYRYDLQGSVFMNPAFMWDFNGSWQSFASSSVFGLAYRRFIEQEDLPYTHPAYYFQPYSAGPTAGQSEVPEFTPVSISQVH